MRTDNALTDQIALVVLDGLYIAGAQRVALQTLQTLSNRGLLPIVLALNGGGHWLRMFALHAEAVVIGFQGRITWRELSAHMPMSPVLCIAHLNQA